MNKLGAGVVFALMGIVTAQRSTTCTPEGNGSVHDFSADLLDGSDTINFADYAGKQEPGANATEIYNSLAHVRPGNGFVPGFQLFEKVEVNGATASPLYKYLKNSCPAPMPEFRDKSRLMYDLMNSNDIRWNFEKFIVDQSGLPYMRFEPSTLPENLAQHIEELIARQTKLGCSKSTKRPARSPLRQL